MFIISACVDSIPKHYNFFKETNKSAVLVTELLGQDLEIAQQKSNLRRFSTITVMKIGLQVVSLYISFGFNRSQN